MRLHRVEVLEKAPHAGRGFTQGLLAEPDGLVVESTGQYGQSALRRYRPATGEVAAGAALAPELFGEGICQVGDSIWQLTWKERKALRWDAATLELREIVSYNRDGWGICALSGDAAGDDVITSDGTSELVRRDPQTLQPRDLIKVRCQGDRVRGLNDLAWSGGRVWANVAVTQALVGIDPATGEVTDIVDAGAAHERFRADPQAIMNGIAALPGPGEFLLTGKGWQWIRHVRLAPARGRDRVAPDRLLATAGQFF
jgi:glutaminyl-peptide cyclotransferase